jgi:flagella basal body P-ring formation protein FlgA
MQPNHRRNALHTASVAALVVLTLITTSGLLSADEVNHASIQAATEDCVRRAFGGEGEVVVETGRIPPLGELEGQDLDIRPRLVRPPDARGPVLISLDFWKDGQRAGQRSVSARVEVYREVLVAARRLDRHELIGEEDVGLERIDIRSLGGKFFASGEGLTGRRTRKIIPEGAVILTTDVEKIPVVERGETILLVVRVGGITVRATGKALEDGAEGDEIDVKNDRSGKRLRGVVTDKGLVEVELAIGPSLGG